MRIVLVTGLYIATLLLVTNQNAGMVPPFPTQIPPATANDTLMVLPAACFQGAVAMALETTQQSFRNETAFQNTLFKSTPNNHLNGWNFFLLMVMFYIIAVIIEIVRFVQHRSPKDGPRPRKHKTRWLQIIGYWSYLLFQFAGVSLSMVAIIWSYRYIVELRRWMGNSGLMHIVDNFNPESDWSSFGQLVPMFLCLLVLFTFAQVTQGMFILLLPSDSSFWYPRCVIISLRFAKLPQQKKSSISVGKPENPAIAFSAQSVSQLPPCRPSLASWMKRRTTRLSRLLRCNRSPPSPTQRDHRRKPDLPCLLMDGSPRSSRAISRLPPVPPCNPRVVPSRT
jgi:hypothetical protein